MSGWKQVGLAILLCSLAAGALAAVRQDPGSEMRLTKFRFTEAFRSLKVTRADGPDTTSSVRTSSGQETVEFEAPLKSVDIGSFGRSTPFSLKIGNFDFRSTLGLDPEYRPGLTSVTLKVFAPAPPSSKSRSIVGTASLHWDRDKLTGKIDGKIPDLTSIAGRDFIEKEAGDINAETKLEFEFASFKTTMDIPFKGKIGRKTGDDDDEISGEAVTINLRGELKKP